MILLKSILSTQLLYLFHLLAPLFFTLPLPLYLSLSPSSISNCASLFPHSCLLLYALLFSVLFSSLLLFFPLLSCLVFPSLPFFSCLLPYLLLSSISFFPASTPPPLFSSFLLIYSPVISSHLFHTLFLLSSASLLYRLSSCSAPLLLSSPLLPFLSFLLTPVHMSSLFSFFNSFFNLSIIFSLHFHLFSLSIYLPSPLRSSLSIYILYLLSSVLLNQFNCILSPSTHLTPLLFSAVLISINSPTFSSLLFFINSPTLSPLFFSCVNVRSEGHDGSSIPWYSSCT